MSCIREDDKDCSAEELRVKIQVARKIEVFALDNVFRDVGMPYKEAWAQEHSINKQRRLALEAIVQKL